ncbi:hypothetical protein KC19_12G028200 [Ceratodon purpureus]|uniref:Uncharacterized protein n=1 Tax=Ceratodon purpureus TaxID=3225 RepID=A0A8T0G355_CERPU|nr:hypothetical protein KC19_12G028200 [Ceratodon purpureus]
MAVQCRARQLMSRSEKRCACRRLPRGFRSPFATCASLARITPHAHAHAHAASPRCVQLQVTALVSMQNCSWESRSSSFSHCLSIILVALSEIDTLVSRERERVHRLSGCMVGGRGGVDRKRSGDQMKGLTGSE